jgi:hypothetical protein
MNIFPKLAYSLSESRLRLVIWRVRRTLELSDEFDVTFELVVASGNVYERNTHIP